MNHVLLRYALPVALVFAGACFTTTAVDAATIVHPGFESGTITTQASADAGDVGAGWIGPSSGAWAITEDAGNHVASVVAGASTALIQVIEDGHATTGEQTLSFLVANQDSDGHNNKLDISIWGFNSTADVDFKTGGDTPDESHRLADRLFTSVFGHELHDNFGLTAFTLDADLGSGYQYLVIRIEAQVAGFGDTVTADNRISIDNVSLASVPEPASIGLVLGGLALMLGRRRDRRSSNLHS